VNDCCFTSNQQFFSYGKKKLIGYSNLLTLSVPDEGYSNILTMSVPDEGYSNLLTEHTR
jgi:hypothetical protein